MVLTKNVKTTWNVYLTGSRCVQVTSLSKHSSQPLLYINVHYKVKDGKVTCWSDYIEGHDFFKDVKGVYYPVKSIIRVEVDHIKEEKIQLPLDPHKVMHNK